MEKASLACFNSGQRIDDHFVDITEMIEIGKGGQRPVKTTLMSRYACYLAIQNADPAKEIVSLGPNLFRHSDAPPGIKRPGIGGRSPVASCEVN